MDQNANFDREQGVLPRGPAVNDQRIHSLGTLKFNAAVYAIDVYIDEADEKTSSD